MFSGLAPARWEFFGFPRKTRGEETGGFFSCPAGSGFLPSRPPKLRRQREAVQCRGPEYVGRVPGHRPGRKQAPGRHPGERRFRRHLSTVRFAYNRLLHRPALLLHRGLLPRQYFHTERPRSAGVNSSERRGTLAPVLQPVSRGVGAVPAARHPHRAGGPGQQHGPEVRERGRVPGRALRTS